MKYIIMSILISCIVHADDGGLDDSGKPKLKFHYNQRVGFYVNKFFGYCSGTILDWREYEVGYGSGVYYIIGDTQCQGVSADVYSHRDEKDLKECTNEACKLPRKSKPTPSPSPSKDEAK